MIEIPREHGKFLAAFFMVSNSSRVPRVTENSSRYYDPSFDAFEDITTREGKLLAAKGEKFNPIGHLRSYQKTLTGVDGEIDYMLGYILPMDVPVVFVDGSDPEQMEWAFSQSCKLVLMRSNSPEVLMIDHKRSYIDERGMIPARFGIKAVPSMVVRDENQFRIDEIVIGEGEQ